MLASHFKFEFTQPFKGQCIFNNFGGPSPIKFNDKIVGWALIFAAIKDTKLDRLPYFNLVVRGPDNMGAYKPVTDFLIHNFIGIEDRAYNCIFSNDILYDHDTDTVGSIEKINNNYFFLPSNTKNLSSNGRKKLTESENWSIFGNSVEGSYI